MTLVFVELSSWGRAWLDNEVDVEWGLVDESFELAVEFVTNERNFKNTWTAWSVLRSPLNWALSEFFPRDIHRLEVLCWSVNWGWVGVDKIPPLAFFTLNLCCNWPMLEMWIAVSRTGKKTILVWHLIVLTDEVDWLEIGSCRSWHFNRWDKCRRQRSAGRSPVAREISRRV